MATLSEQQASSFLNDAEEYRSVNHRIDKMGLRIYNFLYSKYWKITLFFSIVGLHCLAFIEFPSSLNVNSYLSLSVSKVNRINVPFTVTFSLEAIFLVIILLDTIFQVYLFGVKSSKKKPWLLCLFILMFFTWIDFFVSVGMKEQYFFRLRRCFRPFFAMQKSQLMKKVLKSLSKTVLEIFSAFLLLFLWLITFTLISVSIFNGFEDQAFDEKYHSFYSAFYTLLVLLTTANNPDAMIKLYNHYRLVFIFFLIFMSIGIFVFMNVLMAIIYNEFRSHILDSIQSSLSRRRVAIKALYEVLRKNAIKSSVIYCDEVSIDTLKRVIINSSICKWRKYEMIKVANSLGSEKVDWFNINLILKSLDEHKESKMKFFVPEYKNEFLRKCQKFFLSKYFEIAGLGICFFNVIAITVEVSNKFKSGTLQTTILEAIAWFFISLYIIEQGAKYFAMGYKIYFSKNGSRFDFLITFLILTIKIIETVLIESVSHSRNNYIFWRITMWDLPRITNLLILARAARIVLLIPPLKPIINTLFDIPFRMKSVIGLLLLLFYIYALIGMNIFSGRINSQFFKKTNDCGTYQQLDYGGINFDDFYSSIVVLWCLLIVNNWHTFMEAFEMALNSKFVHIYMISWWILTVIVFMNCVTAFVIEAYTHRKSHYEEDRVNRQRPRDIADTNDSGIHYLRLNAFKNNSFTFEMLFKKDLIEPTEEDLNSSIKKCTFLREQYPHLLHLHQNL